MSEVERIVEANPIHFRGVQDEGYGVQVVGGCHKLEPGGAHIVEFAQECHFKLRLRNANSHCSMVDVSLDEVFVGRFLLQSYTEFDLERPIDRPLNFTFTPHECSEERREKRKGTNQRPQGAIRCSFAPEIGSRVTQLDLKIHHLNKVQRMEMLNESTVSELYDELEADYGAWVREEGYILIHWSSAEYDSPVDDVLNSTMQTTLGTYRRFDDPVRKMSLLHVNRVEVAIEENNSSLGLTFPGPPSLGHVISRLAEKGVCLESDWYLLSGRNRYICGSNWAQDRIPLCQLLHKDEILCDPSAIQLRLLYTPPGDIFVIYVRLMSGQLFQLQVGPQTTIKECQYQLEIRGGPWGMGPKWLYGGTLLDDKYPLEHYGIADKNTLDVVLRLKESGEKIIHRGQPIAVECKTSSAGLLPTEVKPNGNNKAKERNSRKIGRQRTTTLRGRSLQRFIEVDPIIVDERFRKDITIDLMAKDEDTDDDEKGHCHDHKKASCAVQ